MVDGSKGASSNHALCQFVTVEKYGPNARFDKLNETQRAEIREMARAIDRGAGLGHEETPHQ